MRCHSNLSAAESRNIFFPISYVIKCALLSEVPSEIYVFAHPRCLGGVPYKKEIRIFSFPSPKRRSLRIDCVIISIPLIENIDLVEKRKQARIFILRTVHRHASHESIDAILNSFQLVSGICVD